MTVTYPAGQCTDYCARRCPWVAEHVLGNAADWYANAQRYGLRVSARPIVGAVVVYGAGNGYSPQFGHVAVVEQIDAAGGRFRVSEQHNPQLGVTDFRWSNYSDVIGFIVPPVAEVTELDPANLIRAMIDSYYRARFGVPDGENIEGREGWTARALVQTAGHQGDGISRAMAEMDVYGSAADLNAAGLKLHNTGGH